MIKRQNLHKKLSFLVVGIFLAAISAAFSVNYVLAQNDTSDPDEPVSNNVDNEPGGGDAMPDDVRERLEQRLEQRKTNRQIQLNEVDRARIQGRCNAAQGQLRSVKARIDGVQTQRNRVYETIHRRLVNLSDIISATELDTTALDGELETLSTDLESFTELMDEHIQAISDMTDMDCTEDPEGFWASLEAARESQGELREQSRTLRQAFQEDIRPILLSLRQQISDQSEAE